MNISRIILCLVIIMVSACNTVPKTTMRTFSDADKLITKQSNLLILPARVEVNTVDAGNQKTRMYDYEYHLEDIIKHELSSILKAKGYKINLLKRKNIKAKKISGEILDLRKAYEKKRIEMYKIAKIPEIEALNNKTNIGDVAQAIGNNISEDVVLMIDYFGDMKTNSARTKDFAIALVVAMLSGSNSSSGSIPPADVASICVSLVNVKTGDILWSNIAANAQGMIASASANDTKRVRKMLSQLLNKFPAKI